MVSVILNTLSCQRIPLKLKEGALNCIIFNHCSQQDAIFVLILITNIKLLVSSKEKYNLPQLKEIMKKCISIGRDHKLSSAEKNFPSAHLIDF